MPHWLIWIVAAIVGLLLLWVWLGAVDEASKAEKQMREALKDALEAARRPPPEPAPPPVAPRLIYVLNTDGFGYGVTTEPISGMHRLIRVRAPVEGFDGILDQAEDGAIAFLSETAMFADRGEAIEFSGWLQGLIKEGDEDADQPGQVRSVGQPEGTLGFVPHAAEGGAEHRAGDE